MPDQLQALGASNAVLNWHLAYNTLGEGIKPYSLVRVIGRDADGAFQLALPNVYGQNDLAVNGPTAIAPNGYGQISFNWPATVCYTSDNESGADPAAGDMMGARIGYGELYKQYPGFKVIDAPDTTNKLVVVQPSYDYSNALIRITGTKGGSDGKLWEGYLRYFDPIQNQFVDGEQVWWRDPNE